MKIRATFKITDTTYMMSDDLNKNINNQEIMLKCDSFIKSYIQNYNLVQIDFDIDNNTAEIVKC